MNIRYNFLKLMIISSIFHITICQDICNGERQLQLSNVTDTLNFLFGICTLDPTCSFYFHQTEKKNLTTFASLSLPILNKLERDLNKIIQDFCSKKIEHLITREMVYRRKENTLDCPSQMTLKINSDGSQSCVCDSESNCEDPQSTDALIITFLVILIVATAFLLLFTVCNNQYIAYYVDYFK